VALRNAFHAIKNYRVPGATVYTTVEPCAMCAGALIHARVSRVVWGAPDLKFGAAGSVINLFAQSKLNHHVRDVRGQVGSTAASNLLREFFSSKRERRSVLAPDAMQSQDEVTGVSFHVKTATWQDDAPTLKQIRFEVFVTEQGVPAEQEIDQWDPLAIHAIAWVNGVAVACGRLLPDGHIGRMAVRKPFRGKRIGAEVLLHLMARSRQRGDAESVLSAQTHAMGFYEQFGFIANGDEYLDCDIPHRDMRCLL
jgi:predicted GNAT family N-acyltransferase